MRYSSTDLMECLQWKHKHPTNVIRQHALEIIRRGGDIHSVTEKNQTCLHLAISNDFLDVVQLLLEKGIDVNARDGYGSTALHAAYFDRFYDRCQGSAQTIRTLAELVPMLLCHGADPWIQDERNATPLDLIMVPRFPPIVRLYSIVERELVATIEHLYYYMFDRYTEFGLSVYTLLITAYVQPSVFQEIVKTIKEVDLDDLEMDSYRKIKLILMMPSENLRLLLDKFDYVVIALFRLRPLRHDQCSWDKFRLENVYILVGSHLQREFSDWLCEWHPSCKFIEYLFRNPAPLASREEVVYHLLSYGMEMDGEDIETVYKYCGYNELFKFLRFVDVKRCRWRLTEIVPRLVFEVTGDIQKSIEDPQFWVKQMTKLNFEPVLAYYAVPNVKDLCCEMKVKGKESFFKKLLDQPRIPLLMEMARNVFRKYFVERLGITSARQFYESLKLLPISPHHLKIITLETALYS